MTGHRRHMKYCTDARDHVGSCWNPEWTVKVDEAETSTTPRLPGAEYGVDEVGDEMVARVSTLLEEAEAESMPTEQWVLIDTINGGVQGPFASEEAARAHGESIDLRTGDTGFGERQTLDGGWTVDQLFAPSTDLDADFGPLPADETCEGIEGPAPEQAPADHKGDCTCAMCWRAAAGERA